MKIGVIGVNEKSKTIIDFFTPHNTVYVYGTKKREKETGISISSLENIIRSEPDQISERCDIIFISNLIYPNIKDDDYIRLEDSVLGLANWIIRQDTHPLVIITTPLALFGFDLHVKTFIGREIDVIYCPDFMEINTISPLYYFSFNEQSNNRFVSFLTGLNLRGISVDICLLELYISSRYLLNKDQNKQLCEMLDRIN